MSLTIERVAVPSLLRTLNALTGILDKGAAFAEEKGIDPEALLNARLIADMHLQILTEKTEGSKMMLSLSDKPNRPI